MDLYSNPLLAERALQFPLFRNRLFVRKSTGWVKIRAEIISTTFQLGKKSKNEEVKLHISFSSPTSVTHMHAYEYEKEMWKTFLSRCLMKGWALFFNT